MVAPFHQDLKSAVKSALRGALKIFLVCLSAQGCLPKKCAITGTGLASPRELAVDDSINLCPDDTTPYDTIPHHNTPYNYQLVPTDAGRPPTQTSHQGMNFKSLNIKHTDNRSASSSTAPRPDTTKNYPIASQCQ